MVAEKVRGEPMELEIEKINSNPYQPRSDFDAQHLRELANSIEKVGLLNPILVRSKDDRFQVVHGERRLRAFKLLKRKKIPATIREVGDRDMAVFSLIENFQREDLNPIDEALAYKRMVDELEFTHEEIADLIERDRTYVTNKVRLLQLPPEVQEDVRRLTLTPSHAESLLRYWKLLKEGEGVEVPKSSFVDRVLSTNKKPVVALKRTAKKVADGDISLKELRTATKIYDRQLGKVLERRMELSEKAEKLSEFGLEKYSQAVEREELEFNGEALEVASLEQEFTGQEKHFPKCSGQSEIYPMSNGGELKTSDISKIPVFSEEEWRGVNDYARNYKKILRKAFGPRFSFPSEKPIVRETYIRRRDFDTNYGDFLVEANSYEDMKDYEEEESESPRRYVKKGWGSWIVVEFNDGRGGRVRRRYFLHDFLDPDIINLALETANPELFSAFDYDELDIHKVQDYRASWAYFRKETRGRGDAIKAMEKDLANLKNQKPMTPKEIEKKAMGILNKIHESVGASLNRGRFREGRITTKRLPDGSVDEEFYKRKGTDPDD